MEIICAQDKDLFDVASFYAEVGYMGELAPTDKVLVARASEGIIGAVRLCEEEGRLVLRGMYVSPGRRGSGIGSELLSAASLTIGNRECWCLPYAHLHSFYGRAGFRETTPDVTPSFLGERRVRYREKGKKVVVMVRPSNWLESSRPNKAISSLHEAGGIRPATPVDFDSLFELHRTVFQSHIQKIWGWDEEWQLLRFRRDFESSSTCVVRVAGKMVGYIQTDVNADQLYLNNIALHPDVQGQGIGTGLIKKLQLEAAELGVPLNLAVFRTNPRAAGFYEEMGFRRTGETDSHIKMSWQAQPC